MAAGIAVTFGLAACGSDDAGTTVVASTPSTVASAPPSQAATQFRSLANGVCATVRQAVPTALTPADSPARVTRDAPSFAQSARATAESLRRLDAPDELRDSVIQLADAYSSVRRDYASIVGARGGARQSLLRKIVEQQVAIQAQAMRAGLPACGAGAPR